MVAYSFGYLEQDRRPSRSAVSLQDDTEEQGVDYSSGGDDGERRGREISSGSFMSQSRAEPTFAPTSYLLSRDDVSTQCISNSVASEGEAAQGTL